MSSDKTAPLIQIKTVLFPGIALLEEFKLKATLLAIQECFEGGKPMGIMLRRGGNACTIGCLAKIQEVLEGESADSVRVLFKGEDRFRIVDWVEKGESPVVAYEEIHDIEERVDSREMTDLQQQVLSSYKEIVLVVKPERFVQIADATNQAGMAFPLAATTVFDVDVKQSILEEKTEHGRLRTLVRYYRQILPRIKALGGNGFLLGEE